MSIIILNEDEFLLESREPILAWLLSAPAYAAAVYFIYYLLTSIYYYVNQSATLIEWLSALPGFIFLTLAALGLLALALSMSISEYVRVNRRQQIISTWRGSPTISLLRKDIKLSQIEEIICRQKTEKYSGANTRGTAYHRKRLSRTVYIVDALKNNHETLKLIKFTEKPIAKKWGRSIAEFCDKPFKDRLK